MSDEPQTEKKSYEPKDLGQEHSNKVVDFINRKAVSPNDACPVCGSPKNTVAHTAYKIEAQPAEGVPFSGVQMPLFATVCFDCGFVRLFSELIVNHLIKQEEASNPAPTVGGVNGN